ncbi:MAG TPA: hypothetical protein VF597_01390 [Candidatus Saccharimonadales bacterium]|jgi:hypothetical protein
MSMKISRSARDAWQQYASEQQELDEAARIEAEEIAAVCMETMDRDFEQERQQWRANVNAQVLCHGHDADGWLRMMLHGPFIEDELRAEYEQRSRTDEDPYDWGVDVPGDRQ